MQCKSCIDQGWIIGDIIGFQQIYSKNHWLWTQLILCCSTKHRRQHLLCWWLRSANDNIFNVICLAPITCEAYFGKGTQFMITDSSSQLPLLYIIMRHIGLSICSYKTVEIQIGKFGGLYCMFIVLYVVLYCILYCIVYAMWICSHHTSMHADWHTLSDTPSTGCVLPPWYGCEKYWWPGVWEKHNGAIFCQKMRMWQHILLIVHIIFLHKHDRTNTMYICMKQWTNGSIITIVVVQWIL